MSETPATPTPEINPERLAIVLDGAFALAHGNHTAPSPEEEIEMCVMEAVAYVAGEPWSDHPACTCGTLTAFCISLNDNWTEEQRQALKPYIPRLVGTRGPIELEIRRAWAMVDFVIRVQRPILYDAAGLPDAAAQLRALPEISNEAAARAARAALDARAARAARDALAARAVGAYGFAALIAHHAIKQLPKGSSYEVMRDAGMAAIVKVGEEVRAAELQLLDRMIAMKPEAPAAS